MRHRKEGSFQEAAQVAASSLGSSRNYDSQLHAVHDSAKHVEGTVDRIVINRIVERALDRSTACQGQSKREVEIDHAEIGVAGLILVLAVGQGEDFFL